MRHHLGYVSRGVRAMVDPENTVAIAVTKVIHPGKVSRLHNLNAQFAMHLLHGRIDVVQGIQDSLARCRGLEVRLKYL
jgi:hypothetical protein